MIKVLLTLHSFIGTTYNAKIELFAQNLLQFHCNWTVRNPLLIINVIFSHSIICKLFQKYSYFSKHSSSYILICRPVNKRIKTKQFKILERVDFLNDSLI